MKLLSAQMGRRIILTVYVGLTVLILAGCIGVKLKQMEIEQLKAEVSAVGDASAFLSGQPSLGRSFDAHVAIGASSFNTFLAGLDAYEIPITNSFGVKLLVERVRLEFFDGYPTAAIDAKALSSDGEVSISVRVFADIFISAQPERERLTVRFRVRDVVPQIQWGQLTFRKLFLAGSVMSVAAEKYVDALPLTTLPIKANLDIGLDPKERGRVSLPGQGYINMEQKLPRFQLGYSYRATNVVVLDDGVHVFFDLVRRDSP